VDHWSKDQTIMNFNAYLSYVSRTELQPPEHGLLPEAASDELRQASIFYTKFSRAWLNLIPFFTTSGRAGIGRKLAKSGDIVVVFFGMDHPVLLRAHGEYYRHIGDTYVHGIMDGEAVREHRAAGKASTTFSLV